MDLGMSPTRRSAVFKTGKLLCVDYRAFLHDSMFAIVGKVTTLVAII